MGEDESITDRIKKTAIGIAETQDNIGTNLYIEKDILNAGDVIYSGQDVITIDRKTLFVFADDDPLSNWGHICRFQLFDALNGELYQEVSAYFPPYLFKVPETYKSFYNQISFPEEKLNAPQPSNGLPPASDSFYGDSYAVLFSGASEKRHVNDLEYIYRKLTDHFGFNADKIYILNYDGTTAYSSFDPVNDYYPYAPYRYSLPVNGKGTRSELDSVFDELKSRLKSEDKLFIHTNNHGSGQRKELETGQTAEESSLCLYSSKPGSIDLYYADDFASKLAELPKIKKLVVMMEQCHSGGFAEPILVRKSAEQICFSSACAFNRTSSGGLNFNPFASLWTEGITTDQYGIKTDSIKMATIHDALNHTLKVSQRDIPVHKDYPEGCSQTMTMI